MKLYRLYCWRTGRQHFCAGYPRVEFVQRLRGARLYTRAQALDIAARFRRVKLRLTMEEAPRHTLPPQDGLPLGDR